MTVPAAAGSRRHVLVVASQCLADDVPELVELRPVAESLNEVLRDPELGDCDPGLPDGRSLLVADRATPLTHAEVRSELRAACAYAGERGAQLILGLIAHGYASGGSLYMMACDSRQNDRYTGVNVTEELTLAADRAGVDGVVALLDLCEAGAAPPDVGDLTDGERQGTRLVILMAAAAKELAYDLRFTRHLTAVIRKGMTGGGRYLFPAAVKPALQQAISGQTLHLFLHDGFAWFANADADLWLARNRLVDEVWDGALDVEWVRHLTAQYQRTAARRRLLTELFAQPRVALIGPSGTGKTVLMAGLASSSIAGIDAAQALVFCDPRTTVAGVARRIAEQLAGRLPARARTTFIEAKAAAWTSSQGESRSDIWDVRFARPLIKTLQQHPGVGVLIGIDGVDQLHVSVRERLLARLRQLLDDTSGGGLRVVFSAQPSAGADAVKWLRATQVEPGPLDRNVLEGWLDDLDLDDTTRRALLARHDGSWLLARLLLELSSDTAPLDLPADLDSAFSAVHKRALVARPDLAGSFDSLYAILAAVGAVEVPLAVIHAALTAAGHQLDVPGVRDLLALHRHVLVRLDPGTPSESLRPLHAMYPQYLARHVTPERLREADQWLLDALGTLEQAFEKSTAASRTTSDSSSNSRDSRDHDALQRARDAFDNYRFSGRPEHLLGAGRVEELPTAVAKLHEHRELYPADRRNDWKRWLDKLTSAGIPPDVQTYFDLRYQVAFWSKQAGDLREALELFRKLLVDVAGLPKPGNAAIATRGYIAVLTGRLGDPQTAKQLLQELLDDLAQTVDADHILVLQMRGNLAEWTGNAGDSAAALELFTRLQEDFDRVLRSRHEDAMTARLSKGAVITRANVARRTGETQGAQAARRLFAHLQPDLDRVLNADECGTFEIRSDIAHWTGRSGDAQHAQQMFKQLQADAERVLGANHPDTVTIRVRSAVWTGESGDPKAAQHLLYDLVDRQREALGADHPDTLRTRGRLAHWTGQAGDPTLALRLFSDLLGDQQKVLRPTHPDILYTRGNIAHWTAESGDPHNAVEQLWELLPAVKLVLGVAHPETLGTQSRLAHWIGMAGDPNTALHQLEALLPDLTSLVGAKHPTTLKTRSRLAHWIGMAGDTHAAMQQLHVVLEDQETALGPDHPDCATTRERIALCSHLGDG